MMQTIPEIQFEEITGVSGDIGFITLTRQKALNALNHSMFIALNKQLKEWDNASYIKAVIIQAAEGRAFCAGGDIRHAYELKMKNDPNIKKFFYDEYQMNKRIHHFSKPYIALLNGITMGGGVGISWHASHRVATENLIFSMPETGIGFYPDVGTTYFLARIPFHIGVYLGLTGVRLGADDSVEIGFAQHKIPSEQLSTLINEFVQQSLSNHQAVTNIIDQFSLPIHTSELFLHKNEIDNCFSQNTVEEILQQLESHSTEWCAQTAALLKSKSPTSLKVTLQALQQAKTLSFDECMKMEYRLTCRFVQEHDFFEGIRAAIIDKDQQPKWQPQQLSEINPSQVEKYFAPMEQELA